MLLAHCTVLDCSRALPSAGSRIAIRTAMIPITTNSSTSVNPFVERRRESLIPVLLLTACGGVHADVRAD